MSLISLEDVARYPRPGWAIPAALAFTPAVSPLAARRITYLFSQEGGLVRQLYLFDPSQPEGSPERQRVLVTPPGGGVTEENLSLEEKLRRERARQLELGVTSYAWAEKSDRLLIPFSDGLYVQEGSSPLRKRIDSAAGPLIDPQFSPDGEWIAYVQNNELWVVPFGMEGVDGQPRQITHGAGESDKTHGLAEYIAQEEMDRSQGYWWSPDSRFLAFVEVDETQIPIYRIMHQGKDSTGEGALEDHRYPFAGQSNARVRLGVVSRAGDAPVWMDLGQEQDIYLARVHWMPDGSLAAQVENRQQTVLDLICFDPTSGQPTRLLRETSPVWINLNNAFHPLKAGGFVWASEQSGFCHLYLYDGAGQLVRQLTSGEWMVDSVAGVDEEQALAYFISTRESALEAHLYAVSLAGGDVRKITREAGMHQVVLDLEGKRYIDTFHSLTTPPTITLHSLVDGALLATLFQPADPRIADLVLTPPELVTLNSRDGELLYGALYRPQGGSAPYPTIVSVYGGPHVQMVNKSWRMTADLRAQYLCRQGFLVFILDNRGSARRGLAFEAEIKNNMGAVEVRDQVDGVSWLVSQGLADPARVGIYGWSYGGYMAAMSLMRAPETFKAAVAGAPVVHWDGYDTHYTERYMGTPQTNPEGYADSAVTKCVGQMKGRLLLVHGLIDENVHFRHTARLINALIQSRKTYELLLFPDERHMPRSLADRVFMEEQIVDFFKQAL